MSMKVRDAQRLTVILFLAGIVVMLAGCFWEPLVIIGAFAIISCLIVYFLYNRCPHCREFLGREYGTFCPHCGEKVR